MNNMRPKWFAEAMMDGAKPDEMMMDMDDQVDDDGEMPMDHYPMGHHDHMAMMGHHDHMAMMGHHDHMAMMGHHEHMAMMGHHEHMLLAHAYVPWQCYREAFCPKEALMHGTLFPELFGVYPIPQ